jgi:arginine-tRNA-protein transferase
MIVLHRFMAEDRHCFYLPDRPSRLAYELVAALSPEEYEERMNQGYRKFGPMIFRPACESCRECRPIRILASDFHPDRSQRRALKRNTDLTVRFEPPTVDDARLDLYNRYHAAQTARKGWPETEKEPDDYALSFVHTPIPAVEISAWEGETLRAVAITEVTPNVVSGVYHYHDPDLSDRSLGVFVMLQTIELARRLGKSYAYFGYYVAGCPSMSYKARFRPCEILGTDGAWREFAPD